MQAENPLARDGHVSYLEIPATDPVASAAFYEAVFGWKISHHKAGQPSFDDRSGNLIGRWIPKRAVSTEPGFLPFIYVARIDETVARITANGGQMVKPVYPEGDLFVATFRDPAGNVVGLWQFGPR
jgi:predicted enzyme related to lactoylglutathione lyase